MGMREYFSQRLPSPGDVFAVALPRGYFGAIRVIQERATKLERRYEEHYSLVEVTDWMEPGIPELTDPRLRTVRELGGEPFWGWVEGPPPAELRYLGVVAPTPAEAR